MKQKFKLVLGLIAGAGLAVSVASTASAATFSILDSSLNPVGTNATLPVGTGGTTGFDLSSIYGSSSPNVGDSITAFGGASPINGGLFLSGSSTLKFTFLGKEAGAQNAAFTAGGKSITNTGGLGASMKSSQLGAGFVNFFFQTVEAAWEDINGNSVTGETFSIANNGLSSFSGLSLAYGVVFNGGRSVLAFFGDGRGDIDYDDMVVRIDAVPLPATALLMFGAFGGLGALRLRKKKAAAA
jgi:hypothetical protein